MLSGWGSNDQYRNALVAGHCDACCRWGDIEETPDMARTHDLIVRRNEALQEIAKLGATFAMLEKLRLGEVPSPVMTGAPEGMNLGNELTWCPSRE